MGAEVLLLSPLATGLWDVQGSILFHKQWLKQRRFGLGCHEYVDDILEAVLKRVVPIKLKFNPNKMEILLVARRTDPGFKVFHFWIRLDSP